MAIVNFFRLDNRKSYVNISEQSKLLKDDIITIDTRRYLIDKVDKVNYLNYETVINQYTLKDKSDKNSDLFVSERVKLKYSTLIDNNDDNLVRLIEE